MTVREEVAGAPSRINPGLARGKARRSFAVYRTMRDLAEEPLSRRDFTDRK